MLPKALLMTWLVLVTQQDAGQAQLSFHTDANTNSFTLKTPGLQQSFTRYFGAAKPAQQEQQQQLQEQEPVQSQVQAQEQQLDLGMGMMLAASQVKQLMETGGGMQKEQSIEVMGQKMSGALQSGFGEVMKQSKK